MLQAFKDRKPWAAAVVGFILGPIVGMCYLNRGRFALAYLAALFTLAAAVFVTVWLKKDAFSFHDISRVMMQFVTYGVAFIVAGHCYFIAKTRDPSEVLKPYARWYSQLIFLTLPIVCAFGFRIFLFEPFHIPSSSMSPNVNIGDYFFIEKFAYNTSAPERGDIVVFKLPKSPTIKYIKRIIGLPGDTIRIEDDVLYINNNVVPRRQIEDFTVHNSDGKNIAAHQFVETLPEGRQYKLLVVPGITSGQNTAVYTVPAGQYFVLGDNRGNSHDSRHLDIGFIPLANIIGKPVGKDFP